MTKDEIEYKAYLFFRDKGLEYVDNIDELIEYCRDFAFPIVSYFEEKIAELEETNAILSESTAINQKDIEYKVSVIEQRNKKITELKQPIEKMQCCENCAFFKDKTYDICHRIKKLGTRKCAFYKMM